MVKIYLDRVFGDLVSVSYHDAASSEVQAQFPSALKQASERDWPHPLVLLGDKIVMVGDVDAYHLSRLIEEALKN